MKSFLGSGLASGLALALLAGTPALAQATRDPAQIQSGTYAVDPGHTQVGWRVSHMGFSNYAGGFSDVSGSLTLDPKNPAASKLSIKVPVASVTTTSAKLTGELKGDQWLDAGKYPDMTFVSTKVAPAGKDHAKVTGDLTLHGVTKPVTLDVTLVGAGANPLSKKYTVGFEATGTLKRSEFGVKTYVPLIGDELHLTIAGAFERQD
ncbi:Protein YceI [Methylobacterium cerastii]|uniref:Protein YceI n=1 Tax=Methylobacterium cerastii TaxID=932741 RepID=A0ABQ4QL63_9HYPH|nr:MULTISPECIES: YceI family protein [Methylobacterium]TXM65279.1 polyisoprenoid-binding protein [Methylobacterium sp. WL12]TXM93415.1 polyisoprenoid-binding protein [Methylobacterium sp. WL122]TXN82120.1 polyisoprenoid-binding protein [Methylobacterium sp. WL8]GJD45650.1 Protein YceI [Methylobacterium cerastii]